MFHFRLTPLKYDRWELAREVLGEPLLAEVRQRVGAGQHIVGVIVATPAYSNEFVLYVSDELVEVAPEASLPRCWLTDGQMTVDYAIAALFDHLHFDEGDVWIGVLMIADISLKGKQAKARLDNSRRVLVTTGSSQAEALDKLLHGVMQCDAPSITLRIDPAVGDLVYRYFPEDGMIEMPVFGKSTFREVVVVWS